MFTFLSPTGNSTDTSDFYHRVVPFSRDHLRGCVLLVLTEAPSHGWDLPERLGPLGYPSMNTGSRYRVIRAMLQEGLVTSELGESMRGSRRRVYSVTDDGRRWVAAANDRLRDADALALEFLGRYEGVEEARRLPARIAS